MGAGKGKMVHGVVAQPVGLVEPEVEAGKARGRKESPRALSFVPCQRV